MRQSDYERAFSSLHEVVSIGKLNVPSGEVIACDPFFCAIAAPLARKVPPGSYDVQLCRIASYKWGERIALARILFAPDMKVVTFHVAPQESGDSNKFVVESGLACFMDVSTRNTFVQTMNGYYESNPGGNYYDAILAAEFKRNAGLANPEHIGDWDMHYPIAGHPGNIAIFASGLGDGAHSLYWGLGSNNESAVLVADFGLL